MISKWWYSHTQFDSILVCCRFIDQLTVLVTSVDLILSFSPSRDVNANNLKLVAVVIEFPMQLCFISTFWTPANFTPVIRLAFGLVLGLVSFAGDRHVEIKQMCRILSYVPYALSWQQETGMLWLYPFCRPTLQHNSRASWSTMLQSSYVTISCSNSLPPYQRSAIPKIRKYSVVQVTTVLTLTPTQTLTPTVTLTLSEQQTFGITTLWNGALTLWACHSDWLPFQTSAMLGLGFGLL